jgi:predicted secreted protein
MANVPGESVLLYVNTGTTGSPVYTALGSEEALTLARSMGTIDKTDKASAFNQLVDPGQKSWSVNCNGLHVDNDAALTRLRQDWDNHVSTLIKIKTLNGNMYTGEAILTSYSEAAAKVDIVRVSFTLQGASALTTATAT